jgi:hypothetical protein
MTTSDAGVKRATWLLLLVALAATGWVVLRTTRSAHAPAAAADLLSAVPTGPALLVTADVSALGEAAALDLLRAGGGALLGLRETCGFEPLLALRQLAFVVPRTEPGQSPDFALIARTTLEQEPVLRCAEAVIRKRGGKPVRSSVGKFRSVRDQQKPLGEVAIRADGLFVLSGGQYFRDVVDAASGSFVADAEARKRAALHASVRQKLATSQLVLTALPGPLLSLPGVNVFGFGLAVGKDLQLRGYVDCMSASGCGEAHNLLTHLLPEAAKEPGLSGLGNVNVEQHEAKLEVSGHLPREQLGPLVTQLLSP